ncbi:MAG TPA: S41 family peptidase [Anaerolineales bacterium]|nr:S41 family peptidase [Anaerolineales bacterium]
MKLHHLSVLLLTLVSSACSAIASPPDPTPVPLPPAQHMESAFQWLETHAMMSGNVDWTALRNNTAEIIANAQTTADTYPAICKVLGELKDGNAWMLVPSLEIPNFYTGYQTLYPEYRVIIRIDPDSPAEKAGLQVGDRIEQVDGQPPVPYEEADAFPPCNAREIDTSTEEQLLIQRNGRSLQIEVARNRITAGRDPYYPPFGQRLGEVPRGIGYLELTFESGNHVQYPTDVQKLMRNMDRTAVCGWMIDLRRIPGGDVWSYIAAVGPLLGEGELGGFEYSDGRQEAWAYSNGEVFWNNEYRFESEVDGSIYKPKRFAPVALLVSPATQAAGELMLVAFQGRPELRSFGEPTRGLPTLITHTDLSDGSKLLVSGAHSFDRNGTIYNGPIAPDMFVQTDWSKFGTEQDPAIQSALDWLHSQSACMP